MDIDYRISTSKAILVQRGFKDYLELDNGNFELQNEGFKDYVGEIGNWLKFYSFYADCSGRPAAATHSAQRAVSQEMDQTFN